MWKPSEEEVPNIGVEDVPEFSKPYTVHSWKNTIWMFRCSFCSMFTTDEDSVILHVVGHYPETERSSVLDKLVSQKTKETK